MDVTLVGEAVLARMRGPGPHLVGIGGAVAVGKSSIAVALRAALEGAGLRVALLPTDAFLHTNDVLEARGITFRKGFPESYDLDRAVEVLRAIAAASWPVRVPVYSHETYDILPGAGDEIADVDVVVVDGVMALQDPIAALLDVGVYVDADEADVRRWFGDRFTRLTEAARSDPSSFYRMFVDQSADELRATAEQVWDAINGPNLHQHIGPSRSNATVVVRKGPDHTIVDLG